MRHATKDLRNGDPGLCTPRGMVANAIEAVEAQVETYNHARCRDVEALWREINWCKRWLDDKGALIGSVQADTVAVEAQVAEAVARVAALEKMGRLGASPNGDDRTRGDMSPRGFDSPTPAAPTPPAPSAVPAPRGFKKGDVVRHCDHPSEDWTVEEADTGGVWCARVGGLYYADPEFLTLVRAAAAPSAPAEDAGLVERLAEVWIKSVDPKLSWPTGASDPVAVRRGTRGILAAMTAESIRCAPGEVARLTKERDEARAISAATAERVRTETQIATELRKDLDDANDRLTSQSRSIEEMHAEMVDLRAKLAAAEQALDVERRTSIRRNHGESVIKRVTFPSIAAREDELRRGSLAHEVVRAERDALRAELNSIRAALARVDGAK